MSDTIVLLDKYQEDYYPLDIVMELTGLSESEIRSSAYHVIDIPESVYEETL